MQSKKNNLTVRVGDKVLGPNVNILITSESPPRKKGQREIVQLIWREEERGH